MRRTMTGAALLVTAAVLLTGCGSGDGDGKDDRTEAAATAAESPSKQAAPGGATHEVTLEVTGEGSTQIMYHAESDGFDQQQLPWSKTETVELTPAEQKLGYLLSIVPGSVKAADGTLSAAPCVIKVDGKQVADNDGGKDPKGCNYTLK
ncbi:MULTISPECIES: hypothetical protein [unclassified Streptomyces]|uniref:hypothetical protein n=1 Tax=unclassified Streptomyces TaxID=2593676 RepID=UPI003D708D9E